MVGTVVTRCEVPSRVWAVEPGVVVVMGVRPSYVGVWSTNGGRTRVPADRARCPDRPGGWVGTQVAVDDPMVPTSISSP